VCEARRVEAIDSASLCRVTRFASIGCGDIDPAQFMRLCGVGPYGREELQSLEFRDAFNSRFRLSPLPIMVLQHCAAGLFRFERMQKSI
jgi:hypothetical protein